MIPENEQLDSNTLAGEYVLGTLQGQERVDFEQRLNADLRLQSEVDAWQQRLAPLLDGVDPVAPPDTVWERISHRIEPDRSARQAPGGFWNSLSFWRNLGMVAATLVIALGLTLMTARQQGLEMDSVMVVLNDHARAGWVVGARARDGFLNVSAVEPTELPQGKVCQLWMEDEQGHLIPVGLLPHDGSRQMRLPTALNAGNRFKVSVEQTDRLPTDAPSDEIVFEGSLTEI
ncbi:MAG: anti-sigma factor [Candidatus Thiodiazotropha sp. (ex Epidulcina cf. delphinae)]|nr:anti-sigma factor [Candidatus Thiodiazotropha sp. (ex Epidulcina cf. delphinae)]